MLYEIKQEEKQTVRHSFEIELAQTYGIEASIVLCQFEFWITKNKENNKNFREGKYWTYNTNKELAKFFPYMTERQINYTITKLKQENLIETGNFNKHPLDRTIWYTLTNKAFTILQNCKMHITNLSNANDKNVKSKNSIDNINNSLTNSTQILTESTNNARTCVNSAPKFYEVRKFAQENSLSTIANKFYKYYESSNWLDKEGKPFNWKQKLLSWGNSEGMNVAVQVEKPKKNFRERKYSEEELSNFFQFPDDIEI